MQLTSKMLLAICFIFIFKAKTADAEISEIEKVSLEQTDQEAVSIFIDALDQKLANWMHQNMKPPTPDTSLFSKLPDSMPAYSDSVIIARLNALNSPIPLEFNNTVRRFIELYTVERREQVSQMLGLAEYYYPMFEEVLARKGLPLEIKHLATVESALNPSAVSRMGATGIWQFMYPTGRMYGLEVTSWIDKRRDPHAATIAAAKYLSHLHAIYDDWLFAIAAYNCGPGNVNRAIRRSGNKENFWEVYPFLPRETRGYIPAFIAVNYAMNYHKEHYIGIAQTDFQFATDTVLVKEKVHFKSLSEQLAIDKDIVRRLNPQYIRDAVIPASNEAAVIRLPAHQALAFVGYQDTIFAHSQYLLEKDKASTGNPIASANRSHPSHSGPPPGYTRLTYTVKSGDNLGFIAEWYDTRAQNIRNWNNIRGNVIRTGQNLVIYVPEAKASAYQDINKLSFSEKQARNRGGSSTATSGSQEQHLVSEGEDYIYHIVRSGDNLWDIAGKYPGVSVEQIKQLNGITNARRISPGDRLKIRPKDQG